MPANSRNSLIHVAAKIVGGSALAGFGFSFGRDVYRKTKSNIQTILFVIVVAAVLLGAYLSGLWLFRNYKTTREKIIFSIYSILLISPAIVIDTLSYSDASEANNEFFFISLITTFCLFVIGSLVAVFQRNKRQLVWEVEDSNERFLQENYIVEVDEDILRDISINQDYRIDSIDRGGVRLFAIGRRNKRAFIQMDEQGRFVDYSGMVSV